MSKTDLALPPVSPPMSPDTGYEARANEQIMQCLHELEQAMVLNNISKNGLSRLMGCKPAFVMQILDPEVTRGKTLPTLHRVAAALGYQIKLSVEPIH